MAEEAAAASRLAVSTQWARRFTSITEFAEQVLALGVGRVELNYEPTATQIKDLLAVPGLAISSVHLPAPHVTYNGRAAFRLPLNAPDEAERQAALGFARAGLELAAEVGAKTVVVHAGALSGPWPVEGRLRRLYRRDYADSEDYRATYNQLAALRAMYAPPALERTRRSLSQLAEWASRYGLVLGLESRYYYSEIPNLDEAAQLLDEFGAAVGYWHDTGHAENLARLGYTEHEAWLSRLGHRLVGAHLHDIKGLDDHQAPGRGSLDWAKLSPYLATSPLEVIEVNRYNTQADVASGIALLRGHGFR